MSSSPAPLRMFGFILVLIVLGVGTLAIMKTQRSAPRSTTIRVTTSFYPLAEFTRRIGGDRVTVTTIIPSGVEPHAYEPTPADLTTIASSQLFMYNGAGLDPWAEKIATAGGNNNVRMISATAPLTLLSEPGATNGAPDPHVWLDPLLVKKIADQIHDTLVAMDSTHRATYDAGNISLQRDLDILDADYRAQLSHCPSQTFVTSHAAFGYVAARYGLTQVYLSGIAPDEEPSAQKIAQVADQVRRQHITTIFFESLVSPKFADTIARETGAQTAVLDPIEGLTPAQRTAGATYMSIMLENLTALHTALQCP